MLELYERSVARPLTREYDSRGTGRDVGMRIGGFRVETPRWIARPRDTLTNTT
jgi:hypothetical protein